MSNIIARIDSKINGFNERQHDTHDLTKKLMNARNQHPAMYNETNGRCFERNAYDNVKFDFKTNCLY